MGIQDLIPLATEDVFIAVFIFVMVWFCTKVYNIRKKLPPGPIGLPIVGYLPYLKNDPHIKLHHLASKYGDVYSLYLGDRLVVILNGVDAVKEGMNKPEFLSRPSHGAFTLRKDIPSFQTINGKAFHEQRKFMLNCMKELGFGKTALEECVKDEIENFLNVINGWNGQAHEVKTVLAPSMSNNVTALVYGERFDYEDSWRKLLDSRKILNQFLGQTGLHIFFPWIKYMPFFKSFFGYDRVQKALNNLLEFNKERIKEHRNTLNSNHIRDYVDMFLLEMDALKDKNSKDTSFTENMLVGNAGALIGAGSETVHVTIDWCLYIMAVYPDIQKKVQQEIDSVVGHDRVPSYSHHKFMPFTQAVIMEVLRWKTAAPLNLLRCTFEDTTFRGYDIPRGTIILANLWSAHYDTRYWKEPEIFKPERFLTQDGQKIQKFEAYMPFSVGKRSCPGESMAVVEMFIYFTSILLRFDVQLPKGDVPDLDGILTISYAPKPHELRFTPRTSHES